jgi:hypothetical protein
MATEQVLVPPGFVFEALPIDARLRCAEVCTAWRVASSAKELWLHVDLSESSGISSHVSNALLRAACARAGSDLLSVDIYHTRKGNKPNAKAKDEAISVTLNVLKMILCSAGNLQRLRVGILWLKYSEDPFIGFPPAYSHYAMNVDDLRAISQAAAPTCVIEATCDCVVSDHAFSIQCDDDEGTESPIPETLSGLMDILRRQPPLERVRLLKANLSYFFLQQTRSREEPDSRTPRLLEILEALRHQDSLQSIQIYCN